MSDDKRIYTVYYLFFFFWLLCTACGILVTRPGTEPVPPAVETWIPNHWTTREFPARCILIIIINFFFFGCAAQLVGILVPQPGVEPVPPAVEARSLNHWTAREVAHFCKKKKETQ